MTSPLVRSLLNGEFAPVTFRFGFVETSFSSLCQKWFRTIDVKHPNLQTEFTLVTAPLATALLSLEPLTNPSDRYLIVETNSNWTAVFGNGLRVNDVASATGYLPILLSCRGLEIGHTPDFSESKRKDLIRKWGSTLFALYGPTNTDWLNRIRCVHSRTTLVVGHLKRAVRSSHLKSRKLIRSAGYVTGSPLKCWNDRALGIELAAEIIETHGCEG